jgi:hypothetical protein
MKKLAILFTVLVATAILGGAALVTWAPGISVYLVLAMGIVSGGLENARFVKMPATIINFDQRCWHAGEQGRWDTLPANNCSEQDLAELETARRPQPRKEGFNGPIDGRASVDVTFTAKDGIRRTGNLLLRFTQDEFYSWKLGSKVEIMVCSQKPEIIKIDILLRTAC